MSEDPTNGRRPSHIPLWVVVWMLLIAVGWVLFLCVGNGFLMGPTPITAKPMTFTTVPLETTPTSER